MSINEKEILDVLRTRFHENLNRHQGIEWNDIEAKLINNKDKLFTLSEMERTGGEPDVVDYNKVKDEYIFFDCSQESPEGRRNLCYDKEALDARKANKPENNAIDLAKSIGIEILNEEQYRFLQTLGNFDLKTSSWLKTPQEIRKLGGAIFADFRYNNVFVYHNGAQSYYGVRGFRGYCSV